ncbi:MAG: HlyD family efflux transporter periplasmic adaptor subunit [Geitlerinemataceae cyanobacterium]
MTMDIQRVESFQQDQPVILEQPAFWTRAFIWLIVVMTASTLIWAALAKIDHSIPANGKLEPDGSLKELDAPVGGVVKEIHVSGGEKVKKGDLLISFDPTTSEADVEALKARKEAIDETKDAISGGGSVGGAQANLDSLTQRRDALASENEFLRAQVNGGDPGGLVGGSFDENQQQLLNANRQEVASRERAATAEVQTLREQLEQTKIQRQSSIARLPSEQSALASTRERLISSQAQIGTSESRLGSTQDRLASTQERIASARERLLGAQDRLRQAREREANARERLVKEQEILDRIRPVVEQGAVAELQLNRQEQQVLSVQDAVIAAESEISAAQDQIASNQESISATEAEIASVQGESASAQGAISSTLGEIAAIESDIAEREARISDTQNEIERLSKEELRIQAQIAQAEARLDNSLDTSDRDALARIASNQQQIAQIDDQLTQQRLSVQQQSAEVTGELTKAEQALAYRELRSPVDGVVFKVSPKSIGYVISQAEQEPVVSVLPDSLLKGSVDVTNKDIGFIKTGMEVEVQIDAFPATEFGTVPGKLTSIGEDVLPPDQEYNYYRFPVTVTLDQQYIDIGNEEEKIEIPLKSGMAIRANLKVRRRTVLSIFLDKFASQKETLKQVR